MEDSPGDGIRRKQVTEEATNVSELVGLVSMDGFVVLLERLLVALCPDAVEFAETFTDQAEERVVGTLLRTTLDDHVTHFNLQSSALPKRMLCTHFATLGKSNGHELVHCFFIIELKLVSHPVLPTTDHLPSS